MMTSRKLLSILIALSMIPLPPLIQKAHAAVASVGVPTNFRSIPVWDSAANRGTCKFVWDSVPGVNKYRVYSIFSPDSPMVAEVPSSRTEYTIPGADFESRRFSPEVEYWVVSVDAQGNESFASAVAVGLPGMAPGTNITWSEPVPDAPKNLVAEVQWTPQPRVYLSWEGFYWDQAKVFRDSNGVQTVIGDLQRLYYIDNNVSPGQTIRYFVKARNRDLNSSDSPASPTISVTIPSAAPILNGSVSIIKTTPNDDSVLITFTTTSQAKDYRIYQPSQTPKVYKYSGGSTSIEINGLPTGVPVQLRLEAVDRLGPFLNATHVAGDDSHVNHNSEVHINGQGDPSNRPQVIGSVDFTVTPRTLRRFLGNNPNFFDGFTNSDPLVMQPSMPACPAGFNCSFYGNDRHSRLAKNSNWNVFMLGTDFKADLRHNLFVNNLHMMGIARDGGAPYTNMPLHNNNGSLVFIPEKTKVRKESFRGKVLHVTFEVDAHMGGRRWPNLGIIPYDSNLINAEDVWKLSGTGPGYLQTDGDGKAIWWRMMRDRNICSITYPDASNRFTSSDFFDIPSRETSGANGTPVQNLDKRHKFDFYLWSTGKVRIEERDGDGNLYYRNEGNIPAGMSIPDKILDGPMPAFVHEIYHTWNDRPEMMLYNPPQAKYYINFMPHSDERHWDSMGFEIIDPSQLNGGVDLIAPVNGSRFNPDVDIPLEASAVTQSGTISKVEFFEGGNLLGTVTSAPYRFTWRSVPSRSTPYILTAKMTTSANEVFVSPAVQVNVNGVQQAPEVHITEPIHDVTVIEGQQTMVKAQAQDPNAGGRITSVIFYREAVGTSNRSMIGNGTSSNGTDWSLNWTAPSIGEYNLYAEATNQAGLKMLSGVPPVVRVVGPSSPAYTASVAWISLAGGGNGFGNSLNVTVSKGSALTAARNIDLVFVYAGGTAVMPLDVPTSGSQLTTVTVPSTIVAPTVVQASLRMTWPDGRGYSTSLGSATSTIAVPPPPSGNNNGNPPPTPSGSVGVDVDFQGNRHPISPLIYGVNFAEDVVPAVNAGINRWGGNGTSRYNWKLNQSNIGNDWFFQAYPSSNGTPGADYDGMIQKMKTAGAEAMVTIPMLGWGAKAGRSWGFSVGKYGPQQSVASDNADAGNGVKSDGSFVTGNDPRDTSVPVDSAHQKEWVQHLVSRWGQASSGGVKYYLLDNEPGLWAFNHRDVTPVAPSAAQFRDRLMEYSQKIKEADPSAKVCAPEEWGWTSWIYSPLDFQTGHRTGNWSNLPDHDQSGQGDFMPWLMSALKGVDSSMGHQTLDVFTLHHYPQGGEALNDDVSQSMQLKRNRSTRELWDPNYTAESWVNAKVDLVHRMRQWGDMYRVGIPIGLTEYNWGAVNHINGGTAQADILGILGREGMHIATGWAMGDLNSYALKAMQMYRNYDGNKSTFGDVSVAAAIPNPDELSAFAAERSSDGAMTVMVINKTLPSQKASEPVAINLKNFVSQGVAEVYQLASGTGIQKKQTVTFTNSQLLATVPAQSVTLFVIPKGDGSAGVQVLLNPTHTTVVPNGSVGFEAIVTGATNQSVSWSVMESNGGSVNTTGLYSSPAVEGDYHVMATSVEDPSKSAMATVTVQSGGHTGVTVSLSPQTMRLRPGQSGTFVATVTGSANTNVTWSVMESNGGTISGGGVYTAPAIEGSYQVMATLDVDPSKSAMATVIVQNPAACIEESVYDDALKAGWQNWSWETGVNFDSTAQVFHGSNSIAVSYGGAWKGLYVATPSPETNAINMGGCDMFRMAIRPTVANTDIWLHLENGSLKKDFILKDLVPGGLKVNEWNIVSISRDQYAEIGDQLTGMFLMSAMDAGTVFFDRIRFTPTNVGVEVLVSPSAKKLLPNASIQLTAVVSGTSDTGVSWSVVESNGGVIDSMGMYTAPAVDGVYHVVATSVADPSKKAIATITVKTPPSCTNGLKIYGDALYNGNWQSWSWGTTVDFDSTNPVYGGAKAIRADYSGQWSGMYLATWDPTNSAIEFGDCDALEFAVYPTQSDSTLMIHFENGQLKKDYQMTDLVPGGVPANVWTTVSIPVSDLVDLDGSLSGAFWMLSSPNATTVHFDEIGFVKGSTPPAPSPAVSEFLISVEGHSEGVQVYADGPTQKITMIIAPIQNNPVNYSLPSSLVVKDEKGQTISSPTPSWSVQRVELGVGNMSEGSHSLTITAKDANGAVVGTPHTASFIVDRTVPTVRFTKVDAAELAIESSTDFKEAMWSVTLVSDLPVANGSLRRSPARSAPVTAQTSAQTLALTNLLSPGVYMAKVQVRDAAYNLSAPAQAEVMVLATGLGNVRVFPNPWRADRHTGRSIMFDGLTDPATVKIYSLSGQWVKTLNASSGMASWNLKTDSGDSAASGVYLYTIEGSNGSSARGKLAIVR